MPRFAKLHIHEKTEGTASDTSPLLRERIEEAIRSVPENPREGHAPTDKRPMTRAKVMAAWLHCLRISGADIVRVAQAVADTEINYGSLRNWKREPEFQALTEKAEEQIADDLGELYDKSWHDPQAFAAFKRELFVFNECVLEGVRGWVQGAYEHAQAQARTDERTIHLLNFANLGIEYHRLWGTLRRFRREVAEEASGSTNVGVVREIVGWFEKAEKAQDWKLARQAFADLARWAEYRAKREDAKEQAVLVRKDAKSRHAKRKKS